MQCRLCNYPNSKVVETTKDTNRNQITRRRECIKCGKRFTTRENFRDAPKESDYKTQPPRRILEK
jgi:transcriptional repressor NrdR